MDNMPMLVRDDLSDSKKVHAKINEYQKSNYVAALGYIAKRLLSERDAAEQTSLASQAKARHLQDQLWCQALAYAHTGPNCTLDDGWEEEGPLERRKDLILRSPLMEEVLKKLTDETIAISLASQAKLIRKCAEKVRQSMGDCGCELTTGHFSDCGVRQEQNVLSLITPEMKVSEK